MQARHPADPGWPPNQANSALPISVARSTSPATRDLGSRLAHRPAQPESSSRSEHLPRSGSLQRCQRPHAQVTTQASAAARRPVPSFPSRQQVSRRAAPCPGPTGYALRPRPGPRRPAAPVLAQRQRAPPHAWRMPEPGAIPVCRDQLQAHHLPQSAPPRRPACRSPGRGPARRSCGQHRRRLDHPRTRGQPVKPPPHRVAERTGHPAPARPGTCHRRPARPASRHRSADQDLLDQTATLSPFSDRESTTSGSCLAPTPPAPSIGRRRIQPLQRQHHR